ncbi:centromere/kinetochore protein ZW10 [Pseudohyphozyma bogoriensis]|nr:centromere/kinetochore protein ZW10 [Pseudohyphozyma bogoriensis]
MSSAQLGTFLTEIGAGSVSSTITLAPGKEPPLKSIHDRIELEILNVNDQTLSLLKDNWEQFTGQWETTDTLLEQLTHEGAVLEGLEEQTTGSAAVLPQLLTTLASHSALVKSHQTTVTTLEYLSTLSSYHAAITALSSSTTAGSLAHSVTLLIQLQSHPTPPAWIHDTPAWALLVKWSKEEESRLVTAITGALEVAYEFPVAREQLLLQLHVVPAPGADGIKTSELFALLSRISPPSFTTQITRIANALHKNLVTPFLTSPHAATSAFEYSPSPTSLTISLTNNAPQQAPPPLDSLQTLLGTLAPHLPPKPFNTSFIPPLQNSLINAFLLPLLPSTTAALPPYLSLLTSTVDFESKFLPSLGYLDFLGGRGEGLVVTEWARGVESHWAKKVGREVLEAVRKEVVGGDWSEVRVEKRVEIEVVVLPPPPEPKPKEEEKPKVVVQKPVEKPREPTPPPPPREPSPPPAPVPAKRGKAALATASPAASPFPSPSRPPVPVQRIASPSNSWISPAPSSSGASTPALEAEENGDVTVVADEPADAWGLSAEEPAADPFGAPAMETGEGEEEFDEEAGWGWEVEDGVFLSPASGDDDSGVMRLRGGVNEEDSPFARPPPAATRPYDAPPQYRMETCMISQRSMSIMRVADALLVEALAVASPSFPHKSFSSASIPLLKSFVSLFGLYRATAPVFHSRLLLSVPALGMQFANDCEWLGDEVEKVWEKRSGGAGGREGEMKPEVDKAVGMMRSLGEEWREKLIATQRTALMEALDEAKGFLYTEDDSKLAACERSLGMVTHTLEKLGQLWKPVMNSSLYYATLGGLINDVLERVLNEIEDQADISEVESIRLNKLCKVLHGLESLFVEGESSVGREVPIWFKFIFLSELLEASMADILFLFNNGHLVDFSTAEISKLIRALFSDSPARQQNLAHIALGHPDVSASAVSSDEEDEGWGV